MSSSGAGGPSPGPDIIVAVDGHARRFGAGRKILLGRDTSATVQVEHASVSRRHAELAWDGSTWRFRDLGSRFGSWRDGVQISDVPIEGLLRVHLGEDVDAGLASLERLLDRTLASEA